MLPFKQVFENASFSSNSFFTKRLVAVKYYCKICNRYNLNEYLYNMFQAMFFHAFFFSRWWNDFIMISVFQRARHVNFKTYSSGSGIVLYLYSLAYFCRLDFFDRWGNTIFWFQIWVGKRSSLSNHCIALHFIIMKLFILPRYNRICSAKIALLYHSLRFKADMIMAKITTVDGWDVLPSFQENGAFVYYSTKKLSVN